MSAQPDNDEEAEDKRDRDRGLAPYPDRAATARIWTRPTATDQAAIEQALLPMLLATLDQLAHPILALRPDGLLVHANRAARELLAAGKPVVLGEDQRVKPRQSARRSSFLLALQAAAAGQPQPLHWIDDGQSVHAVMRPLDPAPSAPRSTGKSAPVMVVLSPPADSHFDASGFAASYQLSRAETRVLEMLLHGGQAEEAAARLGVGVATVRSQIAAIRRKAGHGSVASLLATLGNLPPLRRVTSPESK